MRKLFAKCGLRPIAPAFFSVQPDDWGSSCNSVDCRSNQRLDGPRLAKCINVKELTAPAP
jgi:hypothetical protein